MAATISQGYLFNRNIQGVRKVARSSKTRTFNLYKKGIFKLKITITILQLIDTIFIYTTT